VTRLAAAITSSATADAQALRLARHPDAAHGGTIEPEHRCGDAPHARIELLVVDRVAMLADVHELGQDQQVTDNTVVMHWGRIIEFGTTDAILRVPAARSGRSGRGLTRSGRWADRCGTATMLAYFKYRYGPLEPTAGAAEETEAGLPATETGSR
jgi:hypothetical protein